MDGRWFTGSADGLIPIILTDLEVRSLGEIIAFARDPENRAREREMLICIDGEGTTVIDTSIGDHKAAPVTDAMKDAAEKGPVRFWHNHPSRDSISHSDWNLAGTIPTIEILAANEGGSLFVGRMLDWADGMDRVIAQFVTISGVVEQRMSDALKTAGVDIDDVVAFSHRTGHVMNLAMARCGLVEYAHRFVDADAANWAVAESNGVVAMGIALATAQIQQVLAAAATMPTSATVRPVLPASAPAAPPAAR